MVKLTITHALIALGVIKSRGKAVNEEITRKVIEFERKGYDVEGINYYYSPKGPFSIEIQTTLGSLRSQGKIETLSPASITDDGLKFFEILENKLLSQEEKREFEKIIHS